MTNDIEALVFTAHNSSPEERQALADYLNRAILPLDSVSGTLGGVSREGRTDLAQTFREVNDDD